MSMSSRHFLASSSNPLSGTRSCWWTSASPPCRCTRSRRSPGTKKSKLFQGVEKRKCTYSQRLKKSRAVSIPFKCLDFSIPKWPYSKILLDIGSGFYHSYRRRKNITCLLQVYSDICPMDLPKFYNIFNTLLFHFFKTKNIWHFLPTIWLWELFLSLRQF